MKLFKTLFVSLGVSSFIIIAVTMAAFLGGTIVWMLWPYTFPVIFPKAVATGIILTKIPWTTSVCTVWLFGILFSSNQSNKKED